MNKSNDSELSLALERIRILEGQLRNKDQLLRDSKELLETCCLVVSEKNALLMEASRVLEEVLETGKYDGLDDLKKKL